MLPSSLEETVATCVTSRRQERDIPWDVLIWAKGGNMMRTFVAVGFNPQNLIVYSRDVLSLRPSERFPTLFQQIFAAFCVLIAKTCIFLFFLLYPSKFHQLLIISNERIFRKTKPFNIKKHFLWRYSDTKFPPRSNSFSKNPLIFQTLPKPSFLLLCLILLPLLKAEC